MYYWKQRFENEVRETTKTQWLTVLSAPMGVSQRWLCWLLDGPPIEQKQAHQEVTARTII